MSRNELYESLRSLYALYGAPWDEVNLFGVRNPADQKLDVFNDWLGIADREGNVRVFKGTTDPGKSATRDTAGGAAHLCLGYHPDLWVVDTHSPSKPAFAHEAFCSRQHLGCARQRIWRDRDRNYRQDPADPVQFDYFFINLHRASIRGSEHIGPYGEGCQVLSRPDDLAEMLGMAKATRRYQELGQRATFAYFLFDTTQLAV